MFFTAEGDRQAGLTLIELLITIAIASVVTAALSGLLFQTFKYYGVTTEKGDLAQEAQFAMERMTDAVRTTNLLLLPRADNPNTTTVNESVRDLLAVTLDPTIDANGDGFADANNDKDFVDANGNGIKDAGEPERIDEDLSQDMTNDNASGIRGIDDDGDGLIDEGITDGAGVWADDDEDGFSTLNEDKFNGLDDDLDGMIDEDCAADMNKDGASGVMGEDDDGDGLVDEAPPGNDDEDGIIDEDWYDPVVFYRSGNTIMERQPSLTDQNGDSLVTGADYTESILAERVSAFTVTQEPLAGGRAQLVTIVLELTGPNGEKVSRKSTVRVKGGR